MKITKNQILFIILIFLIKTTAGQKAEDSKCSIRQLDKSTELKVNTYLKIKKQGIIVALQNDCQFKNNPIIKDTELLKNIQDQDFCQDITQIIDSLVIHLDNGISWNIDNAPPKKPKRFYRKMHSKKSNGDKAVTNRIRFLEFCGRFDTSNTNPCEVTDTYLAYTSIKYKDKVVLKALYKIDKKLIEIKNIKRMEN